MEFELLVDDLKMITVPCLPVCDDCQHSPLDNITFLLATCHTCRLRSCSDCAGIMKCGTCAKSFCMDGECGNGIFWDDRATSWACEDCYTAREVTRLMREPRFPRGPAETKRIKREK